MEQALDHIDIHLETGKKVIVAGAIEWPGWCRLAKDEESALQSLLEHGQRYARALQRGGVEFRAPADRTAFVITERLHGGANTDFGIPATPPQGDACPVSESELQGFKRLLEAFWREFDRMVQTAEGRELRRGPRGGGRDLNAIIEHVIGGEKGYLSRLAWKMRNPALLLAEDLQLTHQACLDALDQAVRQGLPEHGPRGGALWTPRYFVRRVAWHVLDHAWEIEDRMI